MTNEEERDLIMYRLEQLEKSQITLSESMKSISDSLIAVQTWGKAALLLHPLFVGIIVAISMKMGAS
jgi:hypothetical protein